MAFLREKNPEANFLILEQNVNLEYDFIVEYLANRSLYKL